MLPVRPIAGKINRHSVALSSHVWQSLERNTICSTETAMIRGVHTMFYSSQPEKLRAFLRDKLGLSSYTDVGEGWLIFDLPEADMGVHPASPEEGGTSGTPAISFYCDDVKQTAAELKGRGVEFVDEVQDHGYGLVTHFRMPGDFVAQLYQPRYVKKSGKK
jgi:hypothetical protein